MAASASDPSRSTRALDKPRSPSWLPNVEGLLDPDVVRAIDSLPNAVNEYGYDAWGFSPAYAKVAYSIGKKILTPYFRPEVHGIENLPRGRVLIVPNHSGQIPFDGAVVALATLLEASPPRLVRPMVERWFPTVPYVNELIARCGAVLGAPINCRNLLLDDQAILVFPEGIKGSGKPWKQRYKLQPFGRGFMRLALQTQTPVVPCAVIGGEESIVSLHNSKSLARLLGLPYAPIHPLLPVLGLLAYFPVPVKFHLHFGAPLHFEGRADDEDSVIDAKVAVVMREVQSLIDKGLQERRSIF
jgi:1-acyl-sn-glycerol-3-phosphate acyltransferase